MNILPAGSSVIPIHQAIDKENYIRSWVLDAVLTKRSVYLQYARTGAYVDGEGVYTFIEPIRGYCGFIYKMDDVEYDGN